MIPKWNAFCDAYRVPAACASASLGDVLRLWHGLGYPRRARNLHDAATAMVERHNGRVPDQLDQLLALPGIGQYTARAVLAFAFERDEAVVDTNIARVLARTAGERLTPKGVQMLADVLLPIGEGWAWNQCLLDLGAVVCRPVPLCADCPVSAACRWHRGGHLQPDPAVGSAGVSTPQSRFEGSDRQARGHVLKALTAGAVPHRNFERRIVDGLVDDRLVVRDGDLIRLP